MMMMITMRTIGMMMMTMTMGAQSGARLPSDGRAGKKLPLRLKSSPSLLINIMRMTKMVTRVRMNWQTPSQTFPSCKLEAARVKLARIPSRWQAAICRQRTAAYFHPNQQLTVKSAPKISSPPSTPNTCPDKIGGHHGALTISQSCSESSSTSTSTLLFSSTSWLYLTCYFNQFCKYTNTSRPLLQRRHPSFPCLVVWLSFLVSAMFLKMRKNSHFSLNKKFPDQPKQGCVLNVRDDVTLRDIVTLKLAIVTSGSSAT